jgi:hypothetical protein
MTVNHTLTRTVNAELTRASVWQRPASCLEGRADCRRPVPWSGLGPLPIGALRCRVKAPVVRGSVRTDRCPRLVPMLWDWRCPLRTQHDQLSRALDDPGPAYFLRGGASLVTDPKLSRCCHIPHRALCLVALPRRGHGVFGRHLSRRLRKLPCRAAAPFRGDDRCHVQRH